jgi:tetratricopeptide (TPR) repeat protein
MRLAEEIDHPTSFTAMCLGYGTLHMRREDLAAALPVLERGLDVARRGSIYVYVFSLAAAAGRAQALTGRAQEAVALITDFVNQAEARFSALGHSVRLTCLAEALLAAGDVDAAWTRGLQSLDYARRYNEKGHEAWSLHLLGDIARRRDPDDVERAQGFYKDAMSIAAPRGMRPAVAHCHLGLGELYGRAGRPAESREHLRAASDLFRDLGIASLRERAERQLGASGE